MKKLVESSVLFIVVTVGLSGCGAHKPVTNQPPTVQGPTLHCTNRDGLPDPDCTPGAVRTTDVTNICHGGSTKQYRPPTSYTNKLKEQQIPEYGYADTKLSDYEEDHLISLELGGDGSDPRICGPSRTRVLSIHSTKTKLKTGCTSKYAATQCRSKRHRRA